MPISLSVADLDVFVITGVFEAFGVDWSHQLSIILPHKPLQPPVRALTVQVDLAVVVAPLKLGLTNIIVLGSQNLKGAPPPSPVSAPLAVSVPARHRAAGGAYLRAHRGALTGGASTLSRCANPAADPRRAARRGTSGRRRRLRGLPCARLPRRYSWLTAAPAHPRRLEPHNCAHSHIRQQSQAKRLTITT